MGLQSKKKKEKKKIEKNGEKKSVLFLSFFLKITRVR